MSYGAIAIFLFGAYLAVCLMYPILRKNHSCLHCGKETSDYCESCYQELIAENIKWQTNYLRLERELVIKENQINKMIERKNEYIRDLEHIRDCYYNEIGAREQNEILKSNNNRKIDLYEKETRELKYDGTMPIIVWINKEEFLRLKELSKTCDNIDYNTGDGIYIE